MALKIRRDDEVVVISGKDRGKTGRVLRVDPTKSKVYVEGLNIVKRHQRPQQVPGAQRAETVGGVVEKEGPIHISNVMLIDPKDKKAVARAKDAPKGPTVRLKAYEGVVIARSGGGINESFTVRKISYGEGVERVFPLYSPLVDSIKVVRRGKVRRAKLYYLRGLRGKRARITRTIA